VRADGEVGGVFMIDPPVRFSVPGDTRLCSPGELPFNLSNGLFWNLTDKPYFQVVRDSNGESVPVQADIDSHS